MVNADAPLLPDLPILDAHHHLWLEGGHGGSPAYTVDELHADIAASGHNVVGTVFVECHSQYRREGPAELRPVGETEFVVAEAARAAALEAGPPIAAMVGHADLTLGTAVEGVLRAQEEAGGGLFRGVRYTTAWDPHPMNNMAVRGGLMGEETFRDGVRTLGRLGLAYDVFCFHPQLPELVELARACPDVTIVANHFGVPIAGGPYRGHEAETRAFWREQLAALGRCENVVLKLGGITRPLSGDRWDKRATTATPEELVAAWGDEAHHGIDCFGPSRCLFESNFPVDKPCIGYGELWTGFKLLAAGYSPAEQLDLFHDTAARAYGLTPLG